jgi:hypothetical protein
MTTRERIPHHIAPTELLLAWGSIRQHLCQKIQITHKSLDAIRRILDRALKIVDAFDAVCKLDSDGNDGEDAGSRAETIHLALENLTIFELGLKGERRDK